MRWYRRDVSQATSWYCFETEWTELLSTAILTTVRKMSSLVREPFTLMVTWYLRGCNTKSIHSFDFNSILGLDPCLYDKRDIRRHFYTIWRYLMASFVQKWKLAKYCNRLQRVNNLGSYIQEWLQWCNSSKQMFQYPHWWNYSK